jgi:hypothetical protein
VTSRRVADWELLVYTPSVFVRAANTGLAGYGTWKSVRRTGDGLGERVNAGEGRGERKAFGLRDVPPWFFVSVAAKGLTRAGCWRESNRMGWEDFGGVRGTTWRGRMVRGAPRNRAELTKTIIAYWYSTLVITCKWFGCCGIAGPGLGRLTDANSSRSKGPTPSSNQPIKYQETSRLSPVSLHRGRVHSQEWLCHESVRGDRGVSGFRRLVQGRRAAHCERISSSHLPWHFPRAS